MLLKEIKKIRDKFNAYQERPNLSKPAIFSQNFFGYQVVYFQGKLYAFPIQNAPFDSCQINNYITENNTNRLALKLIDLVESRISEPICIDQAYGYSIYKRNNVYYALISEEKFDENDMNSYVHSHKLEELYKRLYSEHLENIEVYVHTGLPKTATTYLQKHVFPHLKDIHYIEKDGGNEFFDKYFLKIRFANHISIENEIRSKFLEYLKYVDEKKILISEEALSEPRNNGRHFLPNTLILAKIFPRVKIIFSIRYQLDLIESFYLQDLRVGGCMHIDAFLRYDKKQKKFLEFEPTLVPKINVYYFDYVQLIDFYISVYGKANVKIMVYELFLNDKNSFINDLCDFIGTKLTIKPIERIEHRSYRWITAYCALWLNRLTYSKDGRLGIIFERPFVRWLDAGLVFFNRQINVVDENIYKIITYKGIRLSLMILRKMLDKFTVNNFVTLLDVLFRYSKMVDNRKILNGKKAQILKDLYSKFNENLDKKYSLNLKKFGYYD